MEGGDACGDVFAVPDEGDQELLLDIVTDELNVAVGVVAGSADLLSQPSVTTTEDQTPAPSSDAYINSFIVTIAETDYIASITGDEIALELPNGTDLEDVDPTVIISNKATIDPAITTGMDFSSPVVLTVTAEDGETETEYTVTLTEAA